MTAVQRPATPRLTEKEMKPIVDGDRSGASIRTLARTHHRSYRRRDS